jgi:outer membrane protein insertion porin family
MSKSVRVFTLLVIAPLIFCSVVLSQTESSSPINPRREDVGRPTLKRRAPTSASSNSVTPEVRNATSSNGFGNNESSLSSASQLKLRFEGLHTSTSVEVLRFFRDRNIEITKQVSPDLEFLSKAVPAVKEFLQGRGYLSAVVDTNRSEEEQTITFLIYEGPRANVCEIRFQGNRTFSSQELLSRMKEYLAAFERLETGYDAEIYDYAIRRLTNFVRSQGYLEAKTGEPKKDISEHGLVISIPIDEGPLYRLGDIKILGARHISPPEIRTMLNLQRGEIANGESIGIWLFEDLKKIYDEMGFIEYTAEPDPHFRPIVEGQAEGIVDFTVNIEEGQQFRIGSIKVLAGNLSSRDLSKLLLIHEGDIFNSRLFEQSINRLNELGLFHKIDKDKDTERRADQEGALLDIVIKLQP